MKGKAKEIDIQGRLTYGPDMHLRLEGRHIENVFENYLQAFPLPLCPEEIHDWGWVTIKISFEELEECLVCHSLLRKVEEET